MINSPSKTDDFIKMISSLSKADDFKGPCNLPQATVSLKCFRFFIVLEGSGIQKASLVKISRHRS